MSSRLIAAMQGDMVAAMKEKDEIRLSVLRMLKASIQLAMTEKGRESELTDQDVQALVRRAVKQREEAAELYRKGGAEECAERELAEAEILLSYLPAQMSDADLDRLVEDVVREVGATDPKQAGRVVGLVMKKASGAADGNRVKAFVIRRLEASRKE